MLSNRYIVFIPLILLVCTAGLYGDGCFVWNKGADLNEPMQKAIIYWKDGREVLVLQVKYEGAAEDFAWIVPLPSQPKVSAIDADKSPFAEISFYTQYRRRWGLKGRAGVDAEEAVTVLERKIVGVYDIAVLAASDATALNKWLNKNGYAFPAKRKDVLEHYTQKKWVYVAMRIDRKALESDEVKKLKVGELQPIRFSFAAKKMVYPLKISSINAGETEVLLYVLADAPMVVKSKHMRAGLSIEENIPYTIHIYSKRYWDAEYGTFRKVAGEELPLTWEALGVPKDTELSLCRYRAVYKVEEMTDDLVFTHFEPMSYWRKRFSREPHKQDYQAERERKLAFTVLAWHDTSLLKEFAKDKYSKNRELVAIHPKTPEELLLELAKDTDNMVKRSLVMNRNVPPSVLQELAKDKNEGIRCEVARHPNTPVDMLEEFIRDENLHVRRYAMHNETITKEMLEFLSEDKDDGIRAGVAYKEKTPIDVLRKLAKDRSWHVRSSVAQQSRLPATLLEELARDKSPEVRGSAALFGKLSVETLVMLSSDENGSVRVSVTHNPRTPVEVLRKLAKDKESYVRANVAGNSNTPEDVLVRLSDDDEYWVRYRVANNPRTPADTLLELSKDDNKGVRMKVAQNRNTPVNTLQILTKDEDPHISKAARLALEKRGL